MPRKRITDDMYFHKETKTWEMRVVINGKRRSFSSKIPEQVIKKHDAAIAAAENEKLDNSAGPLFETVAAVYERRVHEMKYGTRKVYLPAIKRAVERFRGKRMKEIEPYMISGFLSEMADYARTTVANQKTVINAIFQEWIDSPEWHGDSNASELAKMPRGLAHTKREPPTDEQIRIVKEHYLDPDALPAVVYLCTGERRSEACAIQLKDIDFENGVICITKQAECRGNIPHIVDYTKTPAGVRKVPLLNMLRDALAPLRNLPQETYIIGGKKKPLKASQYNDLWVNFWRKYGMAHARITTEKHIRNGVPSTCRRTVWTADVCGHQFRHEYVCMLCEAGVPEEVAILLVGHANAKMIHEVYLALKPKMLQSAAVGLNKLMNGD